VVVSFIFSINPDLLLLYTFLFVVRKQNLWKTFQYNHIQQ